MQLNHKDLAGIPIFLGLSEKDLTDIARKTRFNLRHYKRGSTIVNDGATCTSLVFVIDGWIAIDTFSEDKGYHLEEIVQSTQILEPDKLFGLSPRYHSKCRAYTSCETVSISKEEMANIFEQYMVVRLNFLNLVCKRSQQLERIPWQQRSVELSDRIIAFIKQRSIYPTGRKTLYIKMAQLAHELNASRLEVSNALSAMNKADKIIQRRGTIEVPAIQLL